MPIKNGRYKDSKGDVRHLETNENMVVVDAGQKTLKQKLTEIASNIQDAVSQKVDALFVKDITGDKAQLQTVDKTNLVNAINELKRTGGGSGASLNVFQRTGGTWAVFTASTPTNTFTVAGFNGTEKTIDVYYKGLPLIPNKQFNISNSGEVTLGFQLAVGEIIDYCVSDVSFDYNELANKPDLGLKADKTDFAGFKIYSDLSHIGASMETLVEDIPPLMQDKSILITSTYSANGVPHYPTRGGLLIVKRHSVSRVELTISTYDGHSYFAFWDNGTYRPWKKITTTEDLNSYVNRTQGDALGFTDGRRLSGDDLKPTYFYKTGKHNGMCIHLFDHSQLNQHLASGEQTIPNGLYHVVTTSPWVDISGGIRQVAHNSSRMYVRHNRDNELWSGWKEVATTSKINNLSYLNGWGGGEILCSVSGKIATLNFIVTTKGSTAVGTNIITGLPKPKDHINIFAHAYSDISDINVEHCVFTIYSNDGILKIRGGSPTKPYLAVSVSYEIA